MNIPNLKYYNNKNKIINLTANNNTPIKIKRFSYSNSQTSKQFKLNRRNRNNNLIDSFNKNFSYNNICHKTKNYIFNKIKVSPIIALSIYEKAINKLFDYLRKSLPKNIYIEFKKKYIKFVTEELHLENNDIISNISDQDLINLDIKLFVSQNTSYFLNYKKFKDKLNLKLNSNSNSLYKLNKIKLRRGKLSSFNSFNTELKSNNQSLINSSKIFMQPKKKLKNICFTEYNSKNDKEKTKPKKIGIKNTKEISKFKMPKIKTLQDGIEHNKNISITHGNINPLININKENKKNTNIKEKIYKKSPLNNKKKIIIDKIKPENKKEKKEGKDKKTDFKDNEKYSIKQLNLIKENLDDNLKNMFNFSYGNFLNYERESDSSKSLNDIYKFNYNDYNNLKQN